MLVEFVVLGDLASVVTAVPLLSLPLSFNPDEGDNCNTGDTGSALPFVDALIDAGVDGC